MISRYRGPDGAAKFFSDAGIVGFVFIGAATTLVLSIVLAAWSEESQLIASWAQAVAATAAIFAALYGLWYQAQRAQRLADAASKAAEAERVRLRVDAQRRELRAAHAALAACSVWLSASLHDRDEETANKKRLLRVNHLIKITDRLRRFETPDLISDVNVAITTLVGLLDALVTFFLEMVEGLQSAEPATKYTASVALVLRHVASDVEKKLGVLGQDASLRDIAANFSVVQPVADWKWANGWDAIFLELDIKLANIIGPKWASAFDE